LTGQELEEPREPKSPDPHHRRRFASFFAAVLTAAGLEGWTLFAHSAACAALLSLALGSPWPALRLGESTPPAR
jgi:hypothetical protein